MIEQQLLLENSLSAEVKKAFLAVPRHKFIKKFSPDGENWITLTDENMARYRPLIYADTTLLLYADESQTCTISQPTLVLRMLDMLEIQKGMKVIELGAGSGWNAAMLGQLVGPSGKVISLEIIRPMAQQAAENVKNFSMPQVSIIHGDGTVGFESEAPYDRGIFTAGAPEIPAAFFDQIKEGGKLLFVLKTYSYCDLLLSLRKVEGHFLEEERAYVSFVPVTGPRVPKASGELDELLASGKLSIYPSSDYPFSDNKRLIKGHDSVFIF